MIQVCISCIPHCSLSHVLILLCRPDPPTTLGGESCTNKTIRMDKLISLVHHSMPRRCSWQCESSFEVWTSHPEGCEGCMWCTRWNPSEVQLGPSVKPAIESSIEEDQCRARTSGQENQMTSNYVKTSHVNNLTQKLLIEHLVSIMTCCWPSSCFKFDHYRCTSKLLTKKYALVPFVYLLFVLTLCFPYLWYW
jgi:hypothetical protein